MTRSKRANAVGTIALCVLFVVLLFRGFFWNDPAGPSARTEDVDYCALLLMPSLAEELDLDLPSRIRLATRGAALLRELGAGRAQGPGSQPAEAVTDQAGAAILERGAAEIRAILPVAKRRAFEDLFAADGLVRVRFWTEQGSSGSADGGQEFVTFRWSGEGREPIEPKPVDVLEAELRACDRWIPSAEVAERLLAHEHEDVRAAAERWRARELQQPDEAPRRGNR